MLFCAERKFVERFKIWITC